MGFLGIKFPEGFTPIPEVVGNELLMLYSPTTGKIHQSELGLLSFGVDEQAVIDLVNTNTSVNVYNAARLGGQLPNYYAPASSLNNYYTKTNLQTSGQAQVHWGNITSKPTTLSGFGITDGVTGTGSAGKVAFWNSANGLTSNANFLFDNGTLIFANGTGGRGVEMRNSGISFKASRTGGWPMAIAAVDQSNNIIGNIVGGYGGANSFSYAYLGGTAYKNAALYAYPNRSVSINKNSVTSGYTLDVNGNTRVGGNILATGEVTAYTASDARLKTNITSLANSINALDIINALNPVTYTWNYRAVELNGNKNTTSINYGLIAQELDQVVPDLIRPIYGDYKTYDDRGLMTIMLQAIKELKSKVDKLENKN